MRADARVASPVSETERERGSVSSMHARRAEVEAKASEGIAKAREMRRRQRREGENVKNDFEQNRPEEWKRKAREGDGDHGVVRRWHSGCPLHAHLPHPLPGRVCAPLPTSALVSASEREACRQEERDRRTRSSSSQHAAACISAACIRPSRQQDEQSLICFSLLVASGRRKGKSEDLSWHRIA